MSAHASSNEGTAVAGGSSGRTGSMVPSALPEESLALTPTYGSWLNLVERWFGDLTMKQIRRGAHRSVSELERATLATHAR